MTDHRQHLTTEDFAERTPAQHDSAGHDSAGHDSAGHDSVGRQPFDHQPGEPQRFGQGTAEHDDVERRQGDREPVEQTPADHDVAEPDLTDQERLDHEPVPQDRRDAPVEPHGVSTTAGDAPLFTTDDAADYQAEWRALQADFVDDPREAVQRADELVAQVMQTLATTFNEHKHALEEQWQRGDEVQTEELRQALKRYRSFFDRLLSV